MDLFYNNNNKILQDIQIQNKRSEVNVTEMSFLPVFNFSIKLQKVIISQK